MVLTGRDLEVWNRIEEWEEKCFKDSETNAYYSLESKFNQLVKTWKPEDQQRILKVVDSIIFHAHALTQNSNYEKETTEKILDQARIFNQEIHSISDMKMLSIDQLRYIANKQLAKQRLISLTQGGVSGVGGLLLLALDLPLMLTLNLRSIQLTAMTYGYDLSKPFELMLALKVFHIATLPKTMQREGWQHLLLELDGFEDEWLLFDEENSYRSTVWLVQPVKQLAKGMTIFLLRKKLSQGIPLLGMTIGASSNYFLAKQVSEIAHNFYQKRFLLEKQNK